MNALLRMLRKKAQALWLGYALAFGFAVAIPITNHFTLESAMQRMRFVAMDSRSTFYLTSSGSFEDSREIHSELARMAAETIFSRNPDGYDAPERLERLFNPETATQLNKDASRDSEVFKQQQIHQKLETGAIHEINVNNNTALVSVEGQILRTGFFNGRVQNDARKVTLFVRLTVNDSMALNGRYPLVVTSYSERFE
jgi:hypothetical protein